MPFSHLDSTVQHREQVLVLTNAVLWWSGLVKPALFCETKDRTVASWILDVYLLQPVYINIKIRNVHTNCEANLSIRPIKSSGCHMIYRPSYLLYLGSRVSVQVFLSDIGDTIHLVDTFSVNLGRGHNRYQIFRPLGLFSGTKE